jgi:hypothetical protein
MGFGLVIGCTEHLQIAATNNYSAITNSHALYNSLQHALSLLSLLCLHRLSHGNGFQHRGFFSFRVHVLTLHFLLLYFSRCELLLLTAARV